MKPLARGKSTGMAIAKLYDDPKVRKPNSSAPRKRAWMHAPTRIGSRVKKLGNERLVAADWEHGGVDCPGRSMQVLT